MPPAGAVLERAAKFLATNKERSYSPSLSIEQRIADDIYDFTQTLKAAQRDVPPLLIEDVERARVGPGSSIALESGEFR